MADNQSIIKEFLVALGFKVDQKGLKSFEEGIGKATAGVVKMVATIEGAALTIGAGVSAMASRLEQLGFVAQRVGSSGNSLKALGGAAEDFGVSAQTALGSVENLAKFLRNNPAGEAYLHNLGVQTRTANGQLRDMVDILGDVGTEMSKRPQFLASQYGDILGVDQNLLLAMRNPEFLKRLDEIRRKAANNGMDQAAAGAHKFMQSLRELGRVSDNVWTQVQAKLQEKLGPTLERFTNWAEQNAPMIADRITAIATAVIDGAALIVPDIKWIIDKFIELDKQTGGLSTKIALLTAAFVMLGGPGILAGILGVTGAVFNMGVALAGASTAGGGLLGLLGKIGLAGAAVWAGLKLAKAAGLPDVDRHKGIDDLKGDDWLGASAHLSAPEFLKAFGMRFSGHSNDEIVKELLAKQKADDDEAGKNHGATAHWDDSGKPSGASKTATPSGVSADMVVGMFEKLGWSHEQAAGIAANLNQESGFRSDAVGDNGQAYGVAQWHKDRQDEFGRWAGHDIRQSNLEEQLKFVDHELRNGAEQRAGALLMAAKNAQQAGEVVSRYYERPGATPDIRDAEARNRGAAAVTLSANTTINVNGAGDARETARMVADAQGSTNDSLVRAMQGAHG